jgi:hypothetical protein
MVQYLIAWYSIRSHGTVFDRMVSLKTPPRKMMNTLGMLTLLLLFLRGIEAQPDAGFSVHDPLLDLRIPERPQNAPDGSDFANRVAGMSIEEREALAVSEILSGNVPSFSRKLKALKICRAIAEESFELVYYATCDYMAIGSDEDYLYIPLTPSTAQYLADKLLCSLPTSRIVDHIYASSGLTLSPQPIPPSDTMTTMAVFRQHMDSIKHQISELGIERSDSVIVAGHKKDIIISNKIHDPHGPNECVVIYGWHLNLSQPIQPPYNGHIARYVDYSHGVRLICKKALLNDRPVTVEEILKDPLMTGLLSDEGVIDTPYYPQPRQFKQSEIPR